MQTKIRGYLWNLFLRSSFILNRYWKHPNSSYEVIIDSIKTSPLFGTSPSGSHLPLSVYGERFIVMSLSFFLLYFISIPQLVIKWFMKSTVTCQIELHETPSYVGQILLITSSSFSRSFHFFNVFQFMEVV